MLAKSGISQPVELRDHYFSLEDHLTTTPTSEDGEGCIKEVSRNTARHFIPPRSISRLLIERGEYPAVPICFRHPAKAAPGWAEWVTYEVKDDKTSDNLVDAQIVRSLFTSCFCEIYKDDICLRHVVRRWSPVTHTFVCSWGEFTATLEDVRNIMRLPVDSFDNPFTIVLEDEKQLKKLEILKRGAHCFNDPYRFCHWVRYFWGSTEEGKFKEGGGFDSGCRVEAMLAYWLSRFIFADFPYDQVQDRVFLMAIKLAAGVCFPLAPLFLSHFYKKLDHIVGDDKEGAGKYGIDSLASVFFLQVFIWERFKDLGIEPLDKPRYIGEQKAFNLVSQPLPFRWLRKRRVEKRSFKPSTLDNIEQFNFRPYGYIFGFQVLPYFLPDASVSPFLGSTELLLAATAQFIPAFSDSFGPAMETYSPHRVKRQFGIDQDPPLRLPCGERLRDCITKFCGKRNNCDDMLSGNLGRKNHFGTPAPAFLRFWGLQRREFREFIKAGGTRLRPEANNGNKRLVSSNTVRAIMSKLNISYIEVYPHGVECEVGHLDSRMDEIYDGVKVIAVNRIGRAIDKGTPVTKKEKSTTPRRFKPKVVQDHNPPRPVTNAHNVKFLFPSNLVIGKGTKRKASFSPKSKCDAGKRVVSGDLNVNLRRSTRVVRKTSSTPIHKPSIDVDTNDMSSDDGEDDDISSDGDDGEETCRGNDQVESFECEDYASDGEQSNDAREDVSQSNRAASLRDEHVQTQGVTTDILMESPAASTDPYNNGDTGQHSPLHGTCQDAEINALVENGCDNETGYGVFIADADICESRGNEQGGETTLGIGVIATIGLAGEETQPHVTPSCSSAHISNEEERNTLIALATRFKGFTARFNSEERLSISIASMAYPLSGKQSSFEGGEIPIEYVNPLTKFAQKHGGGSFSSLFAEGKSSYQRHVLVREFGSVLYSMEVEEVKDEEIFLAWRDACQAIIEWGLNVDFMLDHLKAAARNFFGYILKSTGLDECCREVRYLEASVIQLRSKLSILERQLEEAQGNLHAKFGDTASPDSLACIQESSWSSQSRAIHNLY